MKNTPPPWQPVLPSIGVRAGDNIVAAFASGVELAVWRTTDGVVQAWENRCPHRGVRLSLGRVAGDRVACAYHGWEFEAHGGRCTRVPAHPHAAAPSAVCVKTYRVAESQGMIWVEPLPSQVAAPSAPQHAKAFFCRSMGIRASSEQVAERLSLFGFSVADAGSDDGAAAWHGVLAKSSAFAFLSGTREGASILHAWLNAKPEPESAELRSVFAALRGVRASIEMSV